MLNRQYIKIDATAIPPIPVGAKFVALDIESTGLCPQTDTIVGIAWAFNDEVGYYTDDISLIKDIFLDSTIEKIFHNAVFDVSFLKSKGYEIAGPINDTMVLAHLLDPDRDSLGLKDLAMSYLGEGALLGAEEMFSWLVEHKLGKESISKAPPEVLTKYAVEDVLNTYSLFKLFCAQVRKLNKYLKAKGFAKNPWDYYLEEVRPLIPVIVDMQLVGVKLDLEATAKRKLKLTQKITKLLQILPHDASIIEAERLLHEKKTSARLKKNKTGVLKTPVAPITFNWDSSDHLKTLFFTVLNYKPLKMTKKGNASINKNTLESYKDKLPWLERLIEYRETKKLVNTYLSNLLDIQVGGNIHANFHITGTTTGRFSSSNPNLQNIPKHGRIKDLFIPRPGHTFIYADYSQLELRIAAHLSQDPLLHKAYTEGLDLHQLTADTIGVTRDLAKTVNFAIIYNASGWRIKDILGLASVEEGDEVKNLLFAKYKVLKKYLDKQVAFMLKYGFVISEFGFIRRLKDINHQDYKKVNASLKEGFNAPVQGFGASLCRRAMIQLHKHNAVIVNQIHDALILETSLDNIEQKVVGVKKIMENIYKLRVPLLVEPKILTSFQDK